MKPSLLGAGAAVSACIFLISPPAPANGRFPASGQIAVHPSDPSRLVVQSTYGILATSDGGARWSWICEQAVGFGGSEDPMMGITEDGTVLAGVFAGLSVTRDGGCQWDFAKGGLADRFVIDLAVERSDPRSVILLISNSTGSGTFSTQIWQSANNGGAWSQAGSDLPGAFLGLTADPAPSDPNRVYASGRLGKPDYLGVLQRSKDRGKTWEQLPIPGSSDTSLPYIGAVDPKNPDVVYVRLDGDPKDTLVVSKDGGESWDEVFSTLGNLFGFALSPDGSTVALGVFSSANPESVGVWTAPAETLEFEKVSPVGPRCLTWKPQGLYACASQFVDGFEVGLSTDAGKTFSPLMYLHTLCGPLACSSESSSGKVCPPLWCATREFIGATSCEDADAGPDGGSTSSTGSGSSGGGPPGGCSCGVPGTVSAGALSGVALAGASLGALRRRRRVSCKPARPGGLRASR